MIDRIYRKFRSHFAPAIYGWREIRIKVTIGTIFRENPVGFNWLDGIIVISYLIGVTLYGSYFRKKQRSIHTYFLGGKTLPSWALALSIVGTETSTLTIISTPGIAFAGDMTFLQLIIGYLVGRKVLGINPVLLLGGITGSMTSGASLSVVTSAAKSPMPSLGYTGAYAFANVLLTVAGSLVLYF